MKNDIHKNNTNKAEPDQHSRIKADTVANGFDSVSNYIRYLALARDRVTERKIWEIHNKIVGSAKDEKVKIGKHYPFINT